MSESQHAETDAMVMVDLTTVGTRRMERHGIVYESTTAHMVEDGPLASAGPFMVSKPHALHVVRVWLNTRRPYVAREVQPSLRADGYRWIDPRGYPTNDMLSVMLSPRMPDRVLIPSARLPIGSTLTTGSMIMLNYPCGHTWKYRIKVIRLRSWPILMPVDGITRSGDHPHG